MRAPHHQKILASDLTPPTPAPRGKGWSATIAGMRLIAYFLVLATLAIGFVTVVYFATHRASPTVRAVAVSAAIGVVLYYVWLVTSLGV